MADNVISNLSIVVNTNADEVAGKFRRLTAAVSSLGSAASSSADDMEDAADAADDMGMQTQEAGIRIGHAESFLRKFARALMNVSSRAIGSFVDAMKGGIAIIGKFIKQMARIAMIRAIRSMIKDIAQSFKDLYGWSRMFGTEYARSMDRINTAAVYLRNSFAAMVAPIINALAPAIDVIVDKIVELFNFVNQIFAALSGAETYTVAKKVAQTWESTFDSTSSGAHQTTEAVKELKRTLLGFDEINKLDKNRPSSSSSGGGSGSSPYTPGYSTMFEEKPLEGFFKQVSDFTSKMPDWLKWLFGGAALIGGFKLITDFIPWLLGKLGELFSINIPDWLKWLFGPKGGGNDNGINIPDHIDIPDADIDVNLDKGDWSVLDDLNNQSAVVSVDLEKAWEGASPGVWAWNLGHNLTLKVDLQPAWEGASPEVWAWNLGHDLTLKVDLQPAWEGASPEVWAWNLGHDLTLKVDLQKAWEGASPAVWAWNKGHDLTLKVDLQKAWDGASPEVWAWNLGHDLTLKVDLQKAWDGASPAVWAWNLGHDLTLKVDLQKAWEGASPEVWAWNKGHDLTLKVDLQKAWEGASPAVWAWNLGHNLTLKVDLQKGDGWDAVDGFGGGSGGGGNTSGSGAGRGKWTVDVDVQMPTKEKSKGLLQKWWDALQWSAKVEVGFAAKLLDKAGKVIDGTVGKALDWIFPGAKAEDNKIDVKVGATAGDGLTYDSSIKKFNIPFGNLDTMATIKASGVADEATGLQLSGNAFVLKSVAGANATVNVKPSVGKGLTLLDTGGYIVSSVTGASTNINVNPKAGKGLALDSKTGKFSLANKEVDGTTATITASGKGAKGIKYDKSKGFSLSTVAGAKTTVTAKVNTGKSDAAAVNALAAGDLVKGVNLNITTKGLKSSTTSSGEMTMDDFGAQALSSATDSLLGFLKVFNKLKNNATKNIKVNVKGSNNLNSDEKKAVGMKDNTEKDVLFYLKSKTVGDYIALALSGVGKTLTGAIQYTIEVAKKSVNWLADVLSSFFSPKKALGGVFSNGMWSSIPQYAGGTTNAHGSLFLAGEAGPEVVGHVGGRTEVLNRSQLAATMYSAVRSAMSGITLDANFYTGGGNEESDYDVMYQAMYDALSAVMARGEERDREKVALLRSINEKDFQPEITASSIAQGMTRMNRRAGTTVVPVGT